MGSAGLGSFGALRAPVAPEAWRFPRVVGALPSKVELDLPTAVHDQGALGSCVGQAFARALEVLVGTGVEFSALALYYEARRASGFPVDQDTGAYMEPAVKALAAYGAGSEALWPYRVDRFADPLPAEYRVQALDHRVLNWYRALGVEEAKSALASGFPCVTAFDVPPGFERVGETGMWVDTGGRAVGGHAVFFYGYDDADECFRVMNSWGSRWGDEGTFLLPYAAYAKSGGRWWDSLVVTLLDEEAGS